MYHITVLKNEVVEYLVKNDRGIYLDVTAGGGGHSEALLQRYPDISVISSDWDYEAVKECASRLSSFGSRSIILHSSFSNLSENLLKLGIYSVNGIIADFGTSQNQLLHREGFSFQYDSFLDMRMSNSHTKILAVDILRSASEKELADIFYYYGNERYARKISSAIVKERQINPIRTSLQLVRIIKQVIPLHKNNKIHPATKVFQALRIAVNKELDQIDTFLKQVPHLIAEEGRIACISFHSLEDGLVKKFYQNNKKEFFIVGDEKIILPSDQEMRLNPASRSAKMRVLEKKYTVT